MGVGVDVVDVSRFSRALARTPRLAERLFTPAERTRRDPASLAARFAAKEALAKALGAPGGLRWHDAEVVVGPRGRPALVIRGSVAAAAADVRHWHLSLTHDAGLAAAVVVAES
ncbi:MAG: holo-ACP synthase [Mycobacteriales bacterium]